MNDKTYFDMEGTPCSLHQLIRNDPEWAESRIKAGEEAILRTEELKLSRARILVLALKHCPETHCDWKELTAYARLSIERTLEDLTNGECNANVQTNPQH